MERRKDNAFYGKPELKRDRGERVFIQALREIDPGEECTSSENIEPTSSRRIRRKVSTYAMGVQRRISVKELRHVIVEESSTDENSGEETANSKMDTETTTKELLRLMENRKTEKRDELVKKFISALTMHGYAQFHEASGIRKIVWGVILAAMAVFIVRLTYLSYRSENYYKQVIEFETQKVNEMSFPTLTICNFFPLYTRAMYKRFPMNITEKDFRWFYNRVISNRKNRRNDWENSERSHFSTLEQLSKKGYRTYRDVLGLFEKHKERDIHSILVRKISKDQPCLYENRQCEHKKLFQTVYRHSSQSLCKQFNPYKVHKNGLVSRGNDRENGLSMFWDISGEIYHFDSGLNGLLMEIHPYGTPHHLVDHRRSIYLEPGVSTNIDIEEIMTKRLHYPFKPNCKEEELKIVKDYPYSKATCEIECFLMRILKKCGCIPDQFGEYARNTRICNVSEMNCIFGASSEIHCHECPVSCESIHYKISTSRLGIGNKWVYRNLKNTPGWENKSQTEIATYINQNIVAFRIGFKSLEKQVRTYKEAVPWHERISMLGGLMGLLLGFSVITGFELLFFLFDYLFITMKYRCTRGYLFAVMQQENVKTALQRKVERMQNGND